ncbi:hypothetical protein GA0074692_5461 [Micromonospora pallida]|uniref:Uncharacterized protein n=1 Tax=Micromonospora pallida TaxID=145854 RepID=A0A1C6TD14_9ACTN|nr:hypothetical protein [Micromonospora pallida]SCL39720.1 hypothetical protein GA0074692_5461 [Micromonospora pallida]
MLLPERLSDVWTRTQTVRILDEGLDDGPLDDRQVLVQLTDQAQVNRAQELTTNGQFAGDICRCLGDLTLALYDADDRILGSATIHGHGRISWERSRFADDLKVAEPTALTLFLAECGVSGRLLSLFTDLVMALGYYERSDTPQFRPAGAPAVLADRQVPDTLRSTLVSIDGNSAANLPEERVHVLVQRLTVAEPDPIARADALLGWLGRLPYPTEALWGEGILVRRLLATLPEADIVAAAATGEPAVALGALNWAVHQPDDRLVAAAIAPTLRRLLP